MKTISYRQISFSGFWRYCTYVTVNSLVRDPGDEVGKISRGKIIKPLVYIRYQGVWSLPWRQWEVKDFEAEE